MRAMSTLLESWACQEPEIIQRTISIGFEDRVSAIIEDFSFAALVALLTKGLRSSYLPANFRRNGC